MLRNSDLDVDSQTDGANAVLSGPDTESESDAVEMADGEDDPAETLYEHSAEAEFGAVSEMRGYGIRLLWTFCCFYSY